MPIEPQCDRCGGYEDVFHALGGCVKAQVVWEQWEFSSHMSGSTLEEVFSKLRDIQSAKCITEFGVIAWDIWNDRNASLWQRRNQIGLMIYRSAMQFLDE
ncbi:hypothetical protein ACFE04_012108 [Oxalis oulophora]